MSDFRRRTVIAKKPYDAEIEWLGSDSSAYIDTDILPNNITKFEIEFSYSEFTASGYIISAYNGEQTNDVRLLLTISNNNGMYYNCGLQAGASGVITIYKETFYKLRCEREGNTLKLYNNDVFITTYSSRAGVQNQKSIVLFNRGKIGDYYTLRDIGAKIKTFKAYEGNNIVIDYKAVRVGQIGYMYDKVSGQLFGNSGTGNFILGPDL